MNLSLILSNRSFKWIAGALAFIVLVIVAINVFVIGGDGFVIAVNSDLNAPLAIVLTVLAVGLWRRMSSEEHGRVLWTGMTFGWACWALAETLFAVYTLLNQNLPYPSVADLFWAIGYIPLGVGLLARIRSLPTRPNRSQTLITAGISTVVILFTIIFIFRPILQEFDPQRLLEGILNLFYPLADVVLLITVFNLFFTYEKGTTGFGWILLSAGFIFNTFSDLLYTYSTWQGLYYPDMKVNVLSRFAVDLPYTVSYLLFILGIYVLRLLSVEEKPAAPVLPIRTWMVRRYGHILIFTQKDDQVMGGSPNFSQFFGADKLSEKSLVNILGVSPETGQSIFEKLHNEGKLSDLPVKVRDRNGTLQDGWVYGVALTDSRKAYNGSNLLVRVRTQDATFDATLGQEPRAMVKFLLENSGSNYKIDIVKFLSDYHLSYIKLLLNVCSNEGGASMAQGLLDELQKTALKHGWPIQFNLETVLEASNIPLEVLREALPVLLDTAKAVASRITDPVIVEAQLKEHGLRFSETVHRDIQRYLKMGDEERFSDEV